MNKKENRVKFVQEVEKDALRIGGLFKESFGAKIFILKGKQNTFTLTLHPEDHHKEIYSIFGRFKFHNKLTSIYTTKFNFHSINPNTQDYFNQILNEL